MSEKPHLPSVSTPVNLYRSDHYLNIYNLLLCPQQIRRRPGNKLHVWNWGHRSKCVNRKRLQNNVSSGNLEIFHCRCSIVCHWHKRTSRTKPELIVFYKDTRGGIPYFNHLWHFVLINREEIEGPCYANHLAATALPNRAHSGVTAWGGIPLSCVICGGNPTLVS